MNNTKEIPFSNFMHIYNSITQKYSQTKKKKETYVFVTLDIDNIDNYPFLSLQTKLAADLGVSRQQFRVCDDLKDENGNLICVPEFSKESKGYTYVLYCISGGDGSDSQGGSVTVGPGSSTVAMKFIDWVTTNGSTNFDTFKISKATIPCQPVGSSVCAPQNRERNLGIMIGIAAFLFIFTIVSCVIYYARKAHTWSKSHGGSVGTTESTASMNEMSSRN